MNKNEFRLILSLRLIELAENLFILIYSKINPGDIKKADIDICRNNLYNSLSLFINSDINDIDKNKWHEIRYRLVMQEINNMGLIYEDAVIFDEILRDKLSQQYFLNISAESFEETFNEMRYQWGILGLLIALRDETKISKVIEAILSE